MSKKSHTIAEGMALRDEQCKRELAFLNANKAKPFDTVGFIIDFESGNCDEEQIIEGFQHLIDTGIVWQLQGSYGRAAESLISQGHCTAPDTVKRDMRVFA